MAEEKKEDQMTLLWWVVGIFLILITLWFLSGGPQRADLRGLFLAPPQPLGPGDAYGPQMGTSSQN